MPKYPAVIVQERHLCTPTGVQSAAEKRYSRVISKKFFKANHALQEWMAISLKQ
jgi:hypothetical protein